MSDAFVNALPPFAVAIPLCAAAVLMPFTKWMPRWVSGTVATASSLAVVAIGVILALYTARHGTLSYWMGGWTPHAGSAIGISFTVDPMNAGLAAFIGLMVLAATMYTCDHFDIVGSLFHTLLMAFLASMAGYALTGDLFNMFVWFELMSAAAIALTAHKIEEAESISGAVNLAVTNTVAGFIVLLGIGLLYGRTGALNLAQIGTALSQRSPDGLVIVALLLIVCGYFVKGSVAPFHFWLDDAHAVAPTPICVLFSGIMVQLALYGVARIYWTVFASALGPHQDVLKALFIGVGIATALIGAVMAYSQRHLKRLLAFSTVSHSGMFVAVMGLFDGKGIAAAALFVLAHGLIKGMLFICSGTFLNRFCSLDEGELGGRGKHAPVTAALYLIGGIALAGAPALGISAAKILFDGAFKDHGLFWIAIVMGLASAIDAGAVLRSGLHVAFGIGAPQSLGFSPRQEVTEVEPPYLERTAWLMVAPAILLLGVAVWVTFDQTLWHGIERAAVAFVDQKGYAASVLANVKHALPPAPAEHRKPEDLIMNLSITVAAVLIAFAGLFREQIPSLARRAFAATLGTPLLRLRLLHSGIFTDYVAYMMFGLAAYGIWLVAAMR